MDMDCYTGSCIGNPVILKYVMDNKDGKMSLRVEVENYALPESTQVHTQIYLPRRET